MEMVETAVTDGVGRIVINRPAALNALDLSMFRALTATLGAWRDDASVRAVTIRGAGRAFCAGGDIRAVRAALLAGDDAHNDELYRLEYAVNACIAGFPKPYAAFIDGYCMGGGMGLAVHGSHRVVSERAVLAMPETAIGFFPDVGCTYVLPRVPRHAGVYVGLTGRRLTSDEAIACGLATHRAAHAVIDALEARVAAGAPVDEVLGAPARARGDTPLEAHLPAIERCFAAPSVAGIIAALEAEDDAWSRETLHVLRRLSPNALCVTLAMLRRGASMPLDACLRMEFAVGRVLLQAPDFAEGVRSVVIDKDRAPRWSPAALADVDTAAVEALVADAAGPGTLTADARTGTLFSGLHR